MFVDAHDFEFHSLLCIFDLVQRRSVPSRWRYPRVQKPVVVSEIKRKSPKEMDNIFCVCVCVYVCIYVYFIYICDKSLQLFCTYVVALMDLRRRERHTVGRMLIFRIRLYVSV